MNTFTRTYIFPIFAAGIAIIPAYPLFKAKTALQLCQTLPVETIKQALASSIKPAKQIGGIVGLQVAAQHGFEQIVFKKRPDGFIKMLQCSMFVSLISAPSLAVFNGLTMGQSPMQSIKLLTVGQTSAIILRETLTLFALRISRPLADKSKEKWGNNKVVEYGCIFSTGFFGSVLSHPADTLLTRWQKNMRVQKLEQLMSGWKTRGIAVGLFYSGYNLVLELSDKLLFRR